MTASYCSTEDMRTYGIPTSQIGDSDLGTLVEVASRITDNYTGMSAVGFDGLFAGTSVQTVVINDVRTPLVPLFGPCPFAMFLASPAEPSIVMHGTPGTQELAYQAAAYNHNDDTIPSPAGYTLTGPATLDGTNYPAVSCAAVPDAVGYRWLRTVGGTSQGLIGSTTTPTINDTGLTATSYSARYISNPYLDYAGVRVDGRVLDANVVQVEPNYVGLRMYLAGFRDADGFIARSQSSVAVGRSPYGSKVEINAKWGYGIVPSVVNRACQMVTSMLVARNGEVPPPLHVTRLAVEGYDVSYSTAQPIVDSTGSPDADRLLMRFRLPQVA